MAEHEPEIPFSVTSRRFTPRSGYEFMQTLTGRTIAEMRWWNARLKDLLDKRWSAKAVARIALQERDEQGWKPEKGS